MIKVIIADDQELLRKSLGQLLGSDQDIEIAKLVDDGAQAVKYAKLLKPDIVMLDIEMPNMNGIEALRIIKRDCPQIKVVILTTFDTAENISGAFLANADSYIAKEISPNELIMAIKCVYSGICVIDKSVKRLLIQKLADSAKMNGFENEEMGEENIEIIKMIVDGKSNKIIAKELGYSEGTVKNKVSKIYEKIGIKDRLQLAVYAMENGLV